MNTGFPYPQSNSGRFPPNDVNRMQASAQAFHQLSRQAELLMNKVENDTHFAKQLRGAAQVDNKDKVKQLISTTIEARFEVSYTPGGLTINLSPADVQECSRLEAFVCW
ncbi:MAG TPA: hypothetical protein VFT51_02230 [Bacillales bacterium]|nr:hypothetical protein [Bacillales bacterium]